MAESIHIKKKSYWIPLLLAILFIGPMLAAWFLFTEQGQQLRVGTINRGTLILPPLPMQKLSLQTIQGNKFNQQQLRGKWILVYVNPNQCQEACRVNLYNMRQIRLALGKDQNRVTRLLIATTKSSQQSIENLIEHAYPGTQFALSTQAKLGKVKPGDLYIVDPHGNIMMSYSHNNSASDVLKDMKKLLKVSQIG